MFLVVADNLGILHRNNENIKGIPSQHDNDITHILDGSPESFDESLCVLELYAEWFGLKMDLKKKKTKVVRIGKNKYSRDAMCMFRTICVCWS